MSRTKRRTGNVEKPYWLNTERETWERINGKWVKRKLSDKEVKALLNKFHSDKGYGWMGNAPKWFRKELESIRRAKAKSEIKRVNKNIDYDYNFDPIKNDMNWNWW